MSKEMTVIVLGLFVIVVPFLGIPGEWRTILLALSGLVLSTVGFLLRGELLSRGTRPNEHHPFEESAGAGQRPTIHDRQESLGPLN